MKKGIVFLAALALAAGLSGCGQGKQEPQGAAEAAGNTADEAGEDQAESGEEEEAPENAEEGSQEMAEQEALARKLSEQMAAGDFAETSRLFSEKVKKQLNEESLKAAWEQTVESIGAYEGYAAAEMENRKGQTVTTALLKYEKSGLSVQFVFNKEGKIDGLWMSYAALPQDSDSYTETAVVIGEYELDGILTVPADAENPPLVILVHGSGQSDMNETVGANRPFQDIAHGLAEQGVASIRYNKRYYQRPELADGKITVADEVLEDAGAAVKYAAETVKAEKIVIAGHSLGGMLAPEICRTNPQVTGMISLAGSPRTLQDIMYDQNRAAAMGLSEEEQEQQLAAVRELLDKARNASAEGTEVIANCGEPYWHSLNQIHSGEIAQGLDIPMLFLQGSADFQVYADKDFARWKELLGDKENCQFKLYENLNHLFMASQGKTDAAEYEVPQKVEGAVISDMAQWIKSI